MILDFFRLSVDAILSRRLRSWLTMLGIFVGIMAVVSLISLGQGLQQGINEEFERVGGDRILITPGGGLETGSAIYSSAKLTDKDLKVVQKNRGIEYVLPLTRNTFRAEYDDTITSLLVMGLKTDSETQAQMQDVTYLRVVEGRYIRPSSKYECLIGEGTHEVFGTDVVIELGDELTIADKQFTVVGVTEKSQSPMQNQKVVISQDTSEELSGRENDYFMLSVKVRAGATPSIVASDIEEDLRKSRDVDEDEEDFSVQTSEDLVSSFNNILAIVQVVLTGIAAISLIVGGIGIMTTMYTSVLERTKQIGIMKAVGAKNKDILLIFIFEAGLLGLIGGIIGVLLGLGLSYTVEQIAIQSGFEILKAYVSAPLVFGALGFSFIVGCLSGLLPARQAAFMKPIKALKY